MCDKCLQFFILVLKTQLGFRLELLLTYQKCGGCRPHWILHEDGCSHVDIMIIYGCTGDFFFLPGTSVYYLKLWHGGAEMIHNCKKKKKQQNFVFWQERCDQERETRKTKCFAVFEKWVTTEDQSNWQPMSCYLCWLFVSMLIHTFLTSSVSVGTAACVEIIQFHLCFGFGF